LAVTIPIFFQPERRTRAHLKGDPMSEIPTGLPPRPSLEQLRKRAKELVRAARQGDQSAQDRFRAAGVRHRAPNDVRLADAQLVLAREHGFRTWSELRKVAGQPASGTDRPLIRPGEYARTRPYRLNDGIEVTTDDVYEMFVAARAGDLDRVKSLVRRAPGLAHVEYNYTPPIHFAVREGHAVVTEFLLEQGVEFAGYRTYPFGDALLTMAEERDHHEVATLLRARLARRFALAEGMREVIEAGRAGDRNRVLAELERNPTLARKSNEVGDTALHNAAYKGDLELVRLLLDAGADPDAVRGDGYRPIHLALMPDWRARVPESRRHNVATLLLERGARTSMFIAAMLHDVDYLREALREDPTRANEEDTNHFRPLTGAAETNDVALAKLLLDHGADPNLPEEGAPRGHSLWTAVHFRRRELAKLLVEHGADPNGMVESSGTPMMRAEGDRELTELLAAHGGKLEKDEQSLGHFIARSRYSDVERMLTADPSLINDEREGWGFGILLGPASAGDHRMIELLMRFGATVPLVTEWAPFYYFKHEATAAFLLEHGMDPDHMNWHRTTLLHYMASEGEMAKARLLAQHGADINAIDDEYRSTPLGLASRRGQVPMVRFLLESGADVNLSGAPWATPLAWARKRGHQEVEVLLEDAGADT
jgi:ankyrin repeat protein